MAKILIIDDDPFIQEILADNAEKLGHDPVSAGTLAEGLARLEAAPFDLAFLDVRLPDGNGLEALPGIRARPSAPEIIIITGVGEASGAEMALQSGAWDYLQKPLSKQEIRLQMNRILAYRESKGRRKKTVSLKRDGIVGASAPINACLDLIAQCADSDVNVLITGETGAGKEVFAQVIHENSDRVGRLFVTVDCAALPEHLVESMLFGHEKGAFTGADRSRKGLISEADGGTLFLDEVGELPLSVQKSFLRVLQERRFRPVGARREIESDFRLISATNRNLDDMTAEGRFRKDLLYRLRTFGVELPPLRARKQDINDLTMYYVHKICKKHDMEVKGMTPEFIDALMAYDWPGNVRELISVLETAALADPENPVLYPMHLPAKVRLCNIRAAIHEKKAGAGPDAAAVPLPAPKDAADEFTPPEDLVPLKKHREAVLEAAEKKYLIRLMNAVRGDIQEACRMSEISQSRLYFLLKKYNIPK